MLKCRHCSEELPEGVEICPTCGRAGGIETITGVIEKSSDKDSSRKTGKRNKKTKKKKCRHCNADIPEDFEICPMCGKEPGAESITDFFS
jgi:RNA polymerase subunit RPABC4/transcription elongation factor Spt4